MNKKKNKLGLIEGTIRRFVILLMVYLMFMVSAWTTLAAFFEDGLGTSWVFWLIIGLSFVIFLAFVAYVEWQQLNKYGGR